MLAVFLAAASVSCGPGTCKEPSETGAGATGTVGYTIGDGRSTSATLAGELDVSNDALHYEDTFVDADGASRGYTLSLTGLGANRTIDLAGHGQVCFPRQSGGADVCSDLAGTITLGALSADCSKPVQGIYSCAESVDGTLDVTSAWQGTTFALHATLAERGSWTTETCEED
jgi:hypothetical protein